MGWLKFTNSRTGEVFDSRVPLGQRVIGRTQRDEAGVSIEEPPYDYEPIFRHPKGKEIWIEDAKFWIVTEQVPPMDIFSQWPEEIQQHVTQCLKDCGVID